MGTSEEFADLITLVCQYRIIPAIHIELPLSRWVEAFDIMRRGEQFGKIVLRISEVDQAKL